MLIERLIFYDSHEIEIRLPFYRSFSTFCNVFGSLCTQVFHSFAWGKRWLEVICVVKSKVIQPQAKYKTRNVQIFNKEKIAQRHSLKSKINCNFKVLLGLIINTITQLNSLFLFFQFNNNVGIVIKCQTKV